MERLRLVGTGLLDLSPLLNVVLSVDYRYQTNLSQ